MASAGNATTVDTMKKVGQPIDSASTPASGPTHTRPTDANALSIANWVAVNRFAIPAHVVDAGEVNDAQTQALIDAAQTYVELSPSGTGLHLFLALTDPLELSAHKKTPYEVYNSGRYFTFTGKPFGQLRDVRTVTPAEANCQAKCDASCSGSCKAEANADCQIDCQASGFADCQVELEGGCKGHCSEPEGALFCDGNYVDAGNNLQECIAALQALFNIEVYADGSAMCSGNTCMAEGEVGCSCTSNGAGDLPLAVLGLGFVAVAVRRRRR